MGKKKIISSEYHSESIVWPASCIGCGTTEGKLKKRKEYFQETTRKANFGSETFNTITIKPVMYICKPCEQKAYEELESEKKKNLILLVVYLVGLILINVIQIDWGALFWLSLILNIVLFYLLVNALIMVISYNGSSPHKAYFKFDRKGTKNPRMIIHLRSQAYGSVFESDNFSFGDVIYDTRDKPYPPQSFGQRLLKALDNL